MAKGSHTSSILTGKDKYCYLTGEERGLEKHHIYFGAGLRQTEKLERHRRTSLLHEADKRKSAAVSHYKRRGRQI